MLVKPLVAVEILVRLGPVPLAEWFFHFAAMIVGTALGSEPARAAAGAVAPALPPSARFATQRFVEGWQYGSGMDYTPPVAPTPMEPAALAAAKRAAAAARAYVPPTGVAEAAVAGAK